MFNHIERPQGRLVYIKFGKYHGRKGVVMESFTYMDGLTVYVVEGVGFKVTLPSNEVLFMGDVTQ